MTERKKNIARVIAGVLATMPLVGVFLLWWYS